MITNYGDHYDDDLYWPMFDLCLPLGTMKTMRKVMMMLIFDDYES